MDKQKILQWYPGHMTKANRQIKEKLKLIDIVVEVLDARLPLGSRNPDMASFTAHKQQVILLNKKDLADPEQTAAWVDYFAAQDIITVPFDAFSKSDQDALILRLKGLNPKGRKQLKVLVCGIPNVGKSTVINAILGRKKTIIGNKPGVTKGQQWLTGPQGLMLLDTPGILWPKFDDPMVGIHLAWIAAIKDTIYEKENITADLLAFLVKYYPGELASLYKIDLDGKRLPEIFDAIAASRGFIIRGGEFDYNRTCDAILYDFRNGKMGRMTIDRCE